MINDSLGPIANESDVQEFELPLLAIDGGGTKTIGVIVGEQGEILTSYQSSATNYHVVGQKQATDTLSNILNTLFDQIQTQLGVSKSIVIKRAVFALAGIDTDKDLAIVKKIVEAAVQNANMKITDLIVENDALSALLGSTLKSPGILVIAGTGSIAFAHNGSGTFVRVGGWGHKMGDEGSGYWIGKKAIQSVLKMYDGRIEKSILFDKVLQHFKLKNVEDLYNWLQGSNYSVHDVSSVSKVVESARQEGDAISLHIMNEALHELFELITCAIKKAGIDSQRFKIVLQGGILQNNAFIKEQLITKIKEKYNQAEVLITNSAPIDLIIQRGLYG